MTAKVKEFVNGGYYIGDYDFYAGQTGEIIFSVAGHHILRFSDGVEKAYSETSIEIQEAV